MRQGDSREYGGKYRCGLDRHQGRNLLRIPSGDAFPNAIHEWRHRAIILVSIGVYRCMALTAVATRATIGIGTSRFDPPSSPICVGNRGEHRPVYGIRPYTSGRNTDTVACIRIRMAVPRIVNGTGRGGIRP